MFDPRLRKFVALMQLLGGSLGFQLAWQMFRMSSQLGLALPMLVLLVYSLITLAGVFLWRNQKHAETLTALAQTLQVPLILSPAFGYYCTAGLALGLRMQGLSRGNFFWFLGSTFHVAWAGPPETAIGVNFVPLLVLYWLIKQPERAPTTPAAPVGAV